jgi:hypothetical protein
MAQNGFGRASSLGLATVRPDGSVDIDREFRSERQDHFDPWMTAGRDGTLYLVWLGFDGHRAPERNMQVGLSHGAAAGPWSPALDAFDARTDCPDGQPGCMDKPMVITGPDLPAPKSVAGREALYVLYAAEGASSGARMVRSFDGGQHFSASIPVVDGMAWDVDVGASGVLHVAAETSTSEAADRMGDRANHVVYVRTTDDLLKFEAPATVSRDDEAIPFFFSNPQIVADEARGWLYVVYPTGGPDGAWDLVVAASHDGGRSWSHRPLNDDPHCANHMTPSAALDPETGTLHVIWIEDRTGVGAVAYAHCSAGAASCSPSEAVSASPFADYQLLRHGPKWMGEYGALLVDGKHRLLHALWTQPVDEHGLATGRIFYARARLQ